MHQDLDALLALARAVAAEAAALLAGVRADRVRAKGNPRDLVTEWDPRSEQTIREQLPERFQRSGFLLEKGMIDAIVHRHDLRERLTQLLALLG